MSSVYCNGQVLCGREKKRLSNWGAESRQVCYMKEYEKKQFITNRHFNTWYFSSDVKCRKKTSL